MRSVGFTYLGILFTVILIAIISVMTMKSSYADIIRDNLEESIVYSVKLCQQDRDKLVYKDSSGNIIEMPKQDIDWDSELGDTLNEQFKADFVCYLTANLDSRITSLDINIYGADASTGILSAEVTANFMYPTGQTDSVSVYRTVILDKYVK